MKSRPPEKAKSYQQTNPHWYEMHRKQRREMMRKIQIPVFIWEVVF